ncbi:MAG: LolA family protein [Chitinophagales bacterium]
MKREKMFRKLIFAIAILFISGQMSFAQSENGLDEESDAILKELAAKYKDYKAIETTVEYVIEYPEEEPISIQLKVWLKGDMYKLERGTQIVMTDNKTMWNYLGDVQELQINDYNEEDEMIKPSQVFDVYNEDYIYRLKEEYVADGKQIKVVELTPINKEQSLFKIDLTINTTDNELMGSKFYEANGTRYSYIIETLEAQDLSDDFFIFDKEKYVVEDEVDMRF